MIIGITGTLGAGKGTTVDFLKKSGFRHYSVREFLIEEIRKRGLDVNRDSMVFVANQLRETYSPSYLAEKLFEKAAQEGGDCVIESLRTVGEIQALRQKGNFHLIAIDASPEIRYSRIQERKNETDNVSFQRFLEDEHREMTSTDPTKQNLKACINLADVKIINNGTLEELGRDVREILNSWGIKPKERTKVSKRLDYISWDDYFMGIALLSAERSKDPSTQTGACIVNQDKKIVGIGYNGFPIGCSDESLPWAREGPFLETKYPYVCHAELNAILNSSTDLKGCKIYAGLFPCGECAKAIIQSGIKEVIYLSDKYADVDLFKASKIMFDQAGVKYRGHIPKRESITIEFSADKV